MNTPIRMLLPRGHSLRNKIVETYSHLYNEWRRTHIGSSAYTVRQLNTNIRNAYSVVRQSFPETSFKLSTYAPWAANGWYEVYYSHWYFAVTFVTLRSGAVRAQIQDGIYEGYHHNDIMNTKPYESKTYKKARVLTESKLRRIITESVRNILNRLLS